MTRQHLYWSLLLHLGFNMFGDDPASPVARENPHILADTSRLRCDRATWDAVTRRMAEVGMNHVLIDVGEGLAWQSHPELAVPGSWTPQELADEVGRLRSLGIEASPKLNFSTCHDAWLRDYAYMVSSQPYYRVCADLIAETAEVFGSPSLFHIGMDEETLENQLHLRQAVVRNPDLWYHDLGFYASCVEKTGARAWMWSDRIWHHPDEFVSRVPKSILQSNWYYRAAFEFDDADDPMTGRVQAYRQLEEAGFDQFPTGSNFVCDTNLADTVRHCLTIVQPQHLKGFLTTPWYPTLDAERHRLLSAVDQMGAARQLADPEERQDTHVPH